jgi:chromosome segregation ATPase
LIIHSILHDLFIVHSKQAATIGECVITRLKLNNFKSYEGEHTIEIQPGFTCVVGPNGSGKSNLMDALAFGFGDRAAHLRSSTFKDLIYTGKDGNEDPAEVGRTMSVSLTVRTVVDVDEDGTAHTEDDVFSRLCSCEGALSYKLNTKTCSKKSFDAAWNEKGVVNHVMYFMVFQVGVFVAVKEALGCCCCCCCCC